MIRYLKQEEKIKSRELWKEAFPEDSESFDDFYFTEKIKNNQILVREEDGEIVSMAHLNPYQLVVKDQIWQIDYLVGVATKADRRHRGYMRGILNRMLVDQYEKGQQFCFLMPADEKIYVPFDFTYIYDQPQWEVEEELEICQLQHSELPQIQQFLKEWLSERYEVYADRSHRYLECFLKEVDSEDGESQLLYHEDQLAGIKAVWGIGDREQRALICQEEFVRESQPPKPAIMARIVNLQEFVEVICLQEDCKDHSVVLKIAVEDRLLEQNHGVYLWHLDKNGSFLEKTAQEIPDIIKEEECLIITIRDLTRWLFGYGTIDLSGQYRCIRPLQGVFLDEVV